MKLIRGGKDMINMTYAQLRDPEFNPTIMKLVQTKMKYKAAKKILKLAKAIRAEQMKSDEVWAGLSDKYLEPFLVEGQPAGLQMKEAFTADEKKAADDALNAFAATEVQLDREKLSPQDLAGVEMTPAELVRLEHLIDDEL